MSMQPRLTRSRSDKMVAGVAGGLGEYFSVDPVIIRLIFVLLTLSSGLGIPVYLVLWLVTPPAPAPLPPALLPNQQPLDAEQYVATRQAVSQTAQQVATPQYGTQQPVDPSQYRFDPQTGQPIVRDDAALGQTINLRLEGENQIQAPPPPPAAPVRRRASPVTLGMVLVVVGLMALGSQLGLSSSIIFPALLILAGFALLFRR